MSLRPRAVSPKVSVCVVFVVSMFMTIMDSTVVNVALPTLARQFHVSTAGIAAVVIGYLVSLAVLIPASGWIGDRWGTRRSFLAALVIFTAASALCGVSQNLVELVLFRVLQGVGGGMMTPIGVAMLFRVFPPYERIQASRILTVPVVLAPATGPLIGGLLIDNLSWRWIFYVNVPIGVLALLFGLLFLQSYREPTPGRFDLPGFVLAGFGLALALFALSEGPLIGWTRPAVICSGLAGTAMIVALIVVELRQPTPMLDLRMLQNRLFRSSSGVALFGAGAFLGTLFVLPLLLQDGRGFSALDSGTTTFTEAIGVMVGAQLCARIYARVGPRRLICCGLAAEAAAILLIAGLGADGSLWLDRALMFMVGAANAQVFQPAQTTAFSTGAGASTGRTSALFNSMRQLGAALGVALLSTMLATVGSRASGSGQSHLIGYEAALVTAAAMALIGLAVGLTIRDRDAASTMRPARSVEPEAAA
ncbi:MAG TPA: MDR family MFS transporter [Candidatus Dormibacteraeota bacterium]|nr:MDR family MFS transporter [Candidatus Dormibacteraeota bacterium]